MYIGVYTERMIGMKPRVRLVIDLDVEVRLMMDEIKKESNSSMKDIIQNLIRNEYLTRKETK